MAVEQGGRHRFSIVLGQRMSWPEMLACVQETERLGFDGLFLVDHFYGLKALDDPTHEAYTMLAALAPFTQRVRLGVMVSGNTYRNPAFLLKQAMTVDHVSGGRVDFGVGAGWVEREHEAYGWNFPSAKERVDRFAEALEIWRLLQAQERTTYEGRYYSLLDAPFQPKSLQPSGLPVLIGGGGDRMLRLTARYAAIWNTVGTPEEAAAANARLDAACAAEGRDPVTLVRSVSPSINLLASVEAFREGATAYHAAGIRDIYLPWPRVPEEGAVLRSVVREVLPAFWGMEPTSLAAAAVRPRRSLEEGDTATVRAILAEAPDGLEGRALRWLMDHPDERIDGDTLRRELGAPDHRSITAALAALGRRFTDAGIDRPWSEAQRGYLLTRARAELLARAWPNGR